MDEYDMFLPKMIPLSPVEELGFEWFLVYTVCFLHAQIKFLSPCSSKTSLASDTCFILCLNANGKAFGSKN